MMTFARVFLASPIVGALPFDVLRERVQQLLDEQALKHNVSLEAGFHSPLGSFGVAAGRDISTETMVPVGSVTKTYTSAATLKAAEEGKIDLYAPAHLYIDPILQAQNGSTLLQLWNNDSTIQTVTVYQLLHMRSGIRDYNYGENEYIALHRAQDEDPFEYLHRLDKRFLCIPGECQSYSSVGYMMLGFVLANASGIQDDWTAYDQRSFMTEEQKAKWTHTLFPTYGPCSSYEGISHQWNQMSWAGSKDGVAHFYDLVGNSCLNGWAMGNLAANAEDIAGFFFELYNGGIIGNESLQLMNELQPMTTGWGAPTLLYGLGVMRKFDYSWDEAGDYPLLGHLGEDYGSECEACGFNSKHNFSIAVLMTSQSGMNCTSPQSLGAGLNAKNDIPFAVYQAILQNLTNGTAAQRPQSEDSQVAMDGELVEDDRCVGKEDYAVTLVANGECTYTSRRRNFYRILNVTEQKLSYHSFQKTNCSGTPSVSTISLGVCAVDYYRQTSVYSIYNTAKGMVAYGQIWRAGGINSCQWHDSYNLTATSIVI